MMNTNLALVVILLAFINAGRPRETFGFWSYGAVTNLGREKLEGTCGSVSHFQCPDIVKDRSDQPSQRNLPVPCLVKEDFANLRMSRRASTARQAEAEKIDEEIEDLCRSLDRSRKRHLSEGLVRGDLVHDRLAVQEASASPLLKRQRSRAETDHGKTPPSDNKMAMTMADFKAYMEENSNKRFDKLEGTMAGITDAVRNVEREVKSNSEKIDKHEDQIRSIRNELDKVSKGPAGTGNARPSNGVSWASIAASTPALPPEDDREYQEARRSLRLWPIPGATTEEVWRSACSFMGQKLGLGSSLSEGMIEMVGRVGTPSGPGVVNEAMVRFKEVSTRDLVMGASNKLAPYTQDGRPTAGIRIEIPKRMKPDFRTLFKYGRNLRARHGEGTRRHVKFDDSDGTLFLNVKLPGDEQWSRVSVEVAKRGMRAKEILSDEALERRLDITGPASIGSKAAAPARSLIQQPTLTGRRMGTSS